MVGREAEQGTSKTESPKDKVCWKVITKLLKGGYSVKVHHGIKIKCHLFMNQVCKFMDQEQPCIPSSASDLLCQTAAVLLGCSCSVSAVIMTVFKVGLLQFFYHLLTCNQSLLSQDQQCNRSRLHCHSSKTREHFAMTLEEQ